MSNNHVIVHISKRDEHKSYMKTSIRQARILRHARLREIKQPDPQHDDPKERGKFHVVPNSKCPAQPPPQCDTPF